MQVSRDDYLEEWEGGFVLFCFLEEVGFGDGVRKGKSDGNCRERHRKLISGVPGAAL